jgi:hypothetical protein
VGHSTGDRHTATNSADAVATLVGSFSNLCGSAGDEGRRDERPHFDGQK